MHQDEDPQAKATNEALDQSGCTTLTGLGIVALIALVKVLGLITLDWFWIVLLGSVTLFSFAIDYLVLRRRR